MDGRGRLNATAKQRFFPPPSLAPLKNPLVTIFTSPIFSRSTFALLISPRAALSIWAVLELCEAQVAVELHLGGAARSVDVVQSLRRESGR